MESAVNIIWSHIPFVLCNFVLENNQIYTHNLNIDTMYAEGKLMYRKYLTLSIITILTVGCFFDENNTNESSIESSSEATVSSTQSEIEPKDVRSSNTETPGDESSSLINTENFVPRILEVYDSESNWIGDGISYSPYRDGQTPDWGSVVSKKNLLEDLKILEKKWHYIRIYGTDANSKNILKVIKENDIAIKVMQGTWLAEYLSESDMRNEVDRAIDLANSFPEIVTAINIGNEIFVNWSAHKLSDQNFVIDLIRIARNETDIPITVADDYSFWKSSKSKKVAAELDFIVMHAYPLWNSITLEGSMDWMKETYSDVQSMHPDKQIVLGESGWATSKSWGGDEAKLMIGKTSEENQEQYFHDYTEWITSKKISSFYFSSFDEEWKGGMNSDSGIAEKNWGIFFSDRTPKKVMESYYPELLSE